MSGLHLRKSWRDLHAGLHLGATFMLGSYSMTLLALLHAYNFPRHLDSFRTASCLFSLSSNNQKMGLLILLTGNRLSKDQAPSMLHSVSPLIIISEYLMVGDWLGSFAWSEFPVIATCNKSIILPQTESPVPRRLFTAMKIFLSIMTVRAVPSVY